MSDGVPAIYHDGHTSLARVVTLRFSSGGTLAVEGADVPRLVFRRSDVRVESRLGNAPRFVRLPNDQRCEVTDNEALEHALNAWGGGRMRGCLHRLETSWRLVIAGVLVLSLVGWLGVAYSVPWSARQVAFMMPERVLGTLGDQTLSTFDKTLFKPSELSSARQAELQGKFREFLRAAGDAGDYRIEFRRTRGLGANAFALPSGAIVVTDELVALAKDDAEIIGVVAHECGHVRHRHILRSVLQNSAIVVVATLVTGDMSAASSLIGAVPAYLLQSQYSQKFESEADEHAVALLRQAGVSPEHLATMLERLEASHRHDHREEGNKGPEKETEQVPAAGEDGEAQEGGVMDYISTHPPTRDRVKAIRDAR